MTDKTTGTEAVANASAESTELERAKEASVGVKHKSCPASIQVKEAPTEEAPHGEFTALVSVFGNTDLVGDVMVPGAFAKSLATYAEKGRTLPIVWSHDWATPESYIGKALEAYETEDGLVVRGAFFDTERAQTVRTLLAEKVVSEFSFAYDVVQDRAGKDGTTELVEVHILEAGPTLKGANPETALLAAKASLEPLAEAKAGRTLSAKNEDSIRQAQALLDGVLRSLDGTAEPAKSEEPSGVKAEEQGLAPETSAEAETSGMNPLVAVALLELTELEN
jgi:uncharacterized protein